MYSELTQKSLEGFADDEPATQLDSLIIDVYLEELPVISRELKRIMETAHLQYIDTEMPIVADLEIGDSYGNMLETDLEECQGINSFDTFKAFMSKKLSSKWEDKVYDDGTVKEGIKTHYLKKGLPEKRIRKNFSDLGWDKWIDIGEFPKKDKEPTK